jgi:hypothetical protein
MKQWMKYFLIGVIETAENVPGLSTRVAKQLIPTWAKFNG